MARLSSVVSKTQYIVTVYRQINFIESSNECMFSPIN